MGRMRHKRNHHARRDISRSARTRARTLDHDQVQANLEDPLLTQKLLYPDHLDIDKPGLGLFYCVPCDRHFPGEVDRAVHQTSKLHKRIAKRMQDEKAYTVEESMRAAGIGIDNKQRGPAASKEKAAKEDEAMASNAAEASSSATTSAPAVASSSSTTTESKEEATKAS